MQNTSPKNIVYKRWLFLLAIAISVLLLLLYIKMPYMFESSGTCEDVSKFVDVIGGKKINTLGHFYLTTIFFQRANLLLYLWAKIDPNSELIPLKEANVTEDPKTYDKIMVWMMKISTTKAKVAAFRALGYNVEIVKKPLEIVGVIPHSPAYGVLKVGDKILKINGIEVKKIETLKEIIGKTPLNKKILLSIKRKEKEMDVKVSVESGKKGKRIGIVVIDPIEAKNLPMEVKFNTHKVSGASAGLMFTLEIMKQASGVDLTGGYQIAGTGAIDEDGNIYPVSGVKFKIIAAEEKGAEHFLVPEKNYEEAKKYAKKINVHPVKTLKDALSVLKKLNPTATIKKE